MRLASVVGAGLLFIFLGAFVALLLALPTMWLWNGIVPNVFGLPVITFWQSLGMCLLARFLFGTGSSSSSSSK